MQKFRFSTCLDFIIVQARNFAKIISFTGILQRFWPELQNSYSVEHFMMTIQKIKICNSLLI